MRWSWWWTGAVFALALALGAAIADRRRRRRVDLDSIGILDWRTVQMLAFIAAAMCGSVAIKG